MSPRKDELKSKLAHERDRLETALQGVDAEMAARRVEGTDGWTTIHDAMRHVASAEASMLVIAQRTAAGTYQPIEGFDLNRYNARQVEKRGAQTWSETLAELRQARQATLATLDEMTDDQLDLRTVHPVWGEVDLAGLFRIIAIHDSLHRKDVETLKAADTPAEA